MPFCLFSCRFSAIRNLYAIYRFLSFPLVRVKAAYSVLKSLLLMLEAKKRHLKHASRPNSSTES